MTFSELQILTNIETEESVAKKLVDCNFLDVIKNILNFEDEEEMVSMALRCIANIGIFFFFFSYINFI